MGHFKISLGIIIDFFIYGVGGIHAVTMFENVEEFLRLNYFILRFSSSAIITTGTLVLIFLRIRISLKKLNEMNRELPQSEKKKFWDLFE